jgi:alpha-tubulin suppressor-like RCC1 family protein
MAYVGANTNYTLIGTDIGAGLVTKEYMIDAYPSLVDTFKTAGLWNWGRNAYGQLGDNTVTNRSSPVQTVAGGTNWKQVSCGSSHTGAIKTDGTLWMWGVNGSGRLGDNSVANKSSPVQTVAAGTNWKQVSCGILHTGAIKTDGTLWMWGGNSYGQLGDNSTTNKSSPVQTVAGGTNWKQVSTSFYHTGAIKTDGTLWLWGFNGSGQLGDSSITHRSSPVQTVAGGTNWKQVSAGGYSATCIKTDGTLWLWGRNSYGQLGDNSTTNKSSPVQTVAGGTNWKQVSCGNSHTGAIKTDGTLWMWGRNTTGQLGDSSITHRSSPVQTISGGTNWKQVSAGGYSATCIKTDGTLWMWGRNSYGQLGDSSITHRSSPVQTVAGGTNWKQVSGGGNFTACIRDDSDDPL